MKFRNLFVEVLGEPYDEKKLNEYIEFVKNKSKPISTETTQSHHLLPCCLFDDYIKEERNQFNLEYNDHVEAHVLLSSAYPIREFMRTLNFMLPKSSREFREYRKKISIAAKISWKKFKKSEKYPEYLRKLRERTTNMMKDWLGAHLAHKYYNEHDGRRRQSEHFKKMWQDPVIREKTIKTMRRVRGTPEMRKMVSDNSFRVWKNKTDEEREQFNEKMRVINRGEEKRKDASEKIKVVWQDPEYRAKQTESRKKSWTEERKRNHSEKMKKKWQDKDYLEKMSNRNKKGKK